MLLIGAGAHLTSHWQAFVAPEPGTPTFEAARSAMQEVVLHAPLGATLWTAIGFFSLAFGALLALFGTTHWILAREADLRSLRRHAMRNALLGIAATGVAAWLHPLPQALLILAAASVLFAFAAWPRPHDL